MLRYIHCVLCVLLLTACTDDIRHMLLLGLWYRSCAVCAVARPVIQKDSEFVRYDGTNGQFGNTGLIVGVGSVESSFLIQWTKCLSDFDDPDYPAVLVFIQYITQVEGPMWKEIRGQGLSYNYG